MTAIEKAIFTLIKKHNEKDEYLKQFNKGIKFASMGRYIKEGYEEFVICSDGDSLTRYEAKCFFTPAIKGDNNVVKYQVNMYSDGSISLYFDGTEYYG